MADRVLTLRELNRATLSRQMLLDRATGSAQAVIERLVGLQAQLASSPYGALWTRLPDFKRDDLASLIEDHSVVKTTMMRATLHLTTAEDYLKFRPVLSQVLEGASATIVNTRGTGDTFDKEELLTVARKFIAENPRTFAEISAMLAEYKPNVDIGSMRYTVRTHIPLVQVPISTGWSYPGNPKFALAESWIGKPIPDSADPDNLKQLIQRYLAAFGPASVRDIQTWSGLTTVKDTVESMRSELVTYRDGKVELFDLPDMPIPDGDIPAPERFLPEFDNILLSHQKRIRIVADEHRKQVYLPALRVAATILVDGFVAGVWKVEKTKSAATLTISPFAALSKQSKTALTDEGERLVRFVESGAKSYEVRFTE